MSDDPSDPAVTRSHIYLVRHGETEWSLSGRHTGRTDLPLTETGEAPARAAGRVLAGHEFGVVFTSPRQRARRTAELAGFGDRAQVLDDLSEWDYGAYEGLLKPEIERLHGGPWSIWEDGAMKDDEGRGEVAADVQARARAVIERVRPALVAGKDALVFSHGHFLRSLAVTWLGVPIQSGERIALDTASLSILGFEHGRHVLRLWNRTPYTE